MRSNRIRARRAHALRVAGSGSSGAARMGSVASSVARAKRFWSRASQCLHLISPHNQLRVRPRTSQTRSRIESGAVTDAAVCRYMPHCAVWWIMLTPLEAIVEAWWSSRPAFSRQRSVALRAGWPDRAPMPTLRSSTSAYVLFPTRFPPGCRGCYSGHLQPRGGPPVARERVGASRASRGPPSTPAAITKRGACQKTTKNRTVFLRPSSPDPPHQYQSHRILQQESG